jgi:hypothetical protein
MNAGDHSNDDEPDPVPTAEAARQVEEWLIRMRGHAWEVCGAARIAPTALYEQTQVEWTDGGWSTDGSDVARSSAWRGIPDDWPALIPEARAEELTELAQWLGDHLDVGTVHPMLMANGRMLLQGTDLADDPVSKTLASALVEYLGLVPRLDADARPVAMRLAVEVVDFLTSDHNITLLHTPVSGIEIEGDRLDEGEISIIRLSADEVGDHAIDPAGIPARRGFGGRSRGWTYYQPPTHAIRVLSRGRRPGPLGGPEARSETAILCALQLLGFELTGTGFYGRFDQPGWINTGHGAGPSTLPTRGEADARHCSADDFVRACAIANRIDATTFTDPTDPAALALHRFHYGCGRENPVDELIDHVVALEIVLLRGVSAELSHRFAVNGAWWIEPDSPSGRAAAAAEFKAIYKARSNLVHGVKYPPRDERKDLAARSRRLARRALLRAVEDGFPTPDDFLDTVLRGQ